MNDIFFVHPGENNEIKKMIMDDINKAKEQVLCAMAFFTDEDISKTIMKSVVRDKRIILNNADFEREDNRVAKELFYYLDCMRLGTYYEGNKSGSHMHNKYGLARIILRTRHRKGIGKICSELNRKKLWKRQSMNLNQCGFILRLSRISYKVHIAENVARLWMIQ